MISRLFFLVCRIRNRLGGRDGISNTFGINVVQCGILVALNDFGIHNKLVASVTDSCRRHDCDFVILEGWMTGHREKRFVGGLMVLA